MKTTQKKNDNFKITQLVDLNALTPTEGIRRPPQSCVDLPALPASPPSNVPPLLALPRPSFLSILHHICPTIILTSRHRPQRLREAKQLSKPSRICSNTQGGGNAWEGTLMP